MEKTPYDFWHLDGITAACEKGVHSPLFVDSTHVVPMDVQSKRNFRRRGFLCGCPLDLKGTFHISHIPVGFDLNFFDVLGLLATPEVAATMAELAKGNVQLFPVAYGDRTRFYHLNVTKSFDCLDEQASGAEYNPRTGEMSGWARLAIHADRVPKETMIFIIKRMVSIIVRDSLRSSLLQRHELRGMKFHPVLS